jgi:fibronectin type 3 domain-containing protein
LQIFNTAGTAVATNVWSGQNFSSGQTLSYSYTWTPASGTPSGTYTVELGVFDSGWATNYYWNSSAATITLTTVPTPPAPTGLTASAGSAQVSLTWAASTGAATYNVYRGTSPGAESATAIKTGLTSTAFTDSTVTNGTTYYYKVAAVNSSGTSPLSNEASATPNGPPAAPANLTASAGSGQVTLKWTATPGAATYNIYRGTTSNGEAATPIKTGVTATTYTDTGLTKGTTYYYKVAAVNASGTSALSNQASAKVH